ncbi:actin-like ATPase domain-containing protein [Aulographum hederae CBS 113979]|uniref:Phosphotransferase n=1 Tax=Aulographum hederae CBS 113979 TaxID=1176131 RepID=A0A6G1H2L3_9PEZI|nr:actin-like ATPase domain-containing protein [Aulographum hederae CBS 113979]
MLDVWRGIAAALDSFAMLPSLVQAIAPSLPSPKLHDVAPPQEQRDRMDEYIREVRRLFTAPLQTTNLLSYSGKLQEQFKVKLQASDICMLPSYNHTLPTGHERGTFLALDVGGSTFRVALVRLCGKDSGDMSMRIVKMCTFKINKKIRDLEGHAFFEWMAERVEEVLSDPEIRELAEEETLSMGLAWSFPIEQTSIRSGNLLDMGKGFRAMQGLKGQDLGDLIMKACRAKNLNVRMDAMVNDSSATLLSKAYRDSSTGLALILGTGTNCAVHLPVSALSHAKFGVRPQSWHEKAKHVVVNTEFSMFGKNILPTTRWDDYLNTMHTHPDFQPFEHLISGRYLGEIVRLILLEAIQTAQLFGGDVPEAFLEPYSLETGTIAVFESDDTPTLSKALASLQASHPLTKQPSTLELHYIRQVCQFVSHRAAAYLAAGLHALWSLRATAEGLDLSDAGHLTVSCNGSVIEKYPSFRGLCQSYLDELTVMSGAEKHSVVLEMSDESAIYGAAVAACCLDET